MEKQEKINPVIVLLLFVLSLVVIGGSVIWAIIGEESKIEKVIDGELLFGDNVRKEYILGEDIGDTSGISMNVEGEEGKDLEFVYDFSTAGTKEVVVYYTSKKNSNVTYKASYKVDVFYVQSIRYETEFLGINKHESTDDSDPVLSNVKIIATLNKPSKEFIAVNSTKNEVILTEDNCTIDYIKENDSLYKTNLYCGTYTQTIYQRVLDEHRLMIYPAEWKDWYPNFFELKNDNPNSTARLFLFVSPEKDRLNGTDGAYGYYVYVNGNTVNKLQFAYYMNVWHSVFHSSDFNEGLNDYFYDGTDGAMHVQYAGNSFSADYVTWTSNVTSGILG